MHPKTAVPFGKCWVTKGIKGLGYMQKKASMQGYKLFSISKICKNSIFCINIILKLIMLEIYKK